MNISSALPRLSIALVLPLTWLTNTVVAQTEPSARTLFVRVNDESGAVVPGASVNAQCGAYLNASENELDGRYKLNLKQSICTVTAAAKGFAPASQVFDANSHASGDDLVLVLHISGESSAITVTARQDAVDVSKIDADPMDLPLAIQTVPAQLVADQGFTRLLDAVRNVSGVTSKEAYMGVSDTFNIRGFDASASLFNGFRRDYYLTINDLATLERVEIIKGPSSVTEGFLEPGGVVNVVTKQPLPDFYANVDLLYGTLGTGRGQFDVNIPITSRLSLRGTAAQEHRGSFRDYIHNDLSATGLALNWTLGERTLLETRFYNTYLTGVPDRGLPLYGTSYESLLALPISRFLGEPADQYKQRNTDISETLHQGLGRGWSMRSGVNFLQLSDYRSNTEVDGPDATYPSLLDREFTVVPGGESTINAVNEFTGEATTFGIHHHLTSGVDFARIYFHYYFTENFDLPLFNPVNPNYGGFARTEGPATGNFGGYTYDTGFYGQDLMTFGRHIRVLAGVRQDVFRYHDHDVVLDTTTLLHQSAFSPRVGIVYQPVTSVSLYANYATSFNPQQGVVLLNGAYPTPSRGRQVEAGVKWSKSTRWTASADVFRIEKTNVANSVPGNTDFSQLTGEEQSKGFELDGTFTVRRGLVVRANFADLKATVTEDTIIPIGSRLLNVPQLQGTLWAEGDIPHTPLSAGFGWFAVGQRDATLPNTNFVASYNRFDAALYWRVRPGLKLQANVQNVGNSRYYTSQDYSLYPGAPLNAVLGLHWTPQRNH